MHLVGFIIRKCNHLKIIQRVSEQYIWKAQKTATLGNANILRKVLMQNNKTFSVVNSVTGTTYCNRTLAATLHTIETFQAYCIIVNTACKGDK